MHFTYIANSEDWLWLGSERIHARCASGAVLEGLKGAKQIVGLGQVPDEFHVFMKNLSQNASFSG